MARFTASDGVEIHYEDVGTGPPILFIHGWMMSGRFFHRQVEALSRRRRCITLDLRGCGGSGSRPGTHTMDRFAMDVEELVRHLRLQGHTLVGWSMGGGIAMRTIDRNGTAGLRGVALVDFPPHLEEDPSVAERVCQKLRADREQFLSGFFKRMFLEPPPPVELEMLRGENAKCATETGCEMYRQLGVGDSRGRTFDLPALLVFPRPGWFPKALEPWKAIFPRHVAPAFERSRHCPFLEEADAFNAALEAFTG